MHIAILGAGVGGVTTAIALARLRHEVSIFERAPEPAQIGAGIVLWPNASFVLDQLGLLGTIASRSGRPRKMRRLNRHGKDLGHLDVASLDNHMGFPSYSILRRDLQAVLLDELSRLGVDVRYGHSAVSIAAMGDGGVHVDFLNGLRLRPDLVVGADGRMRSVARRFVTGDNTPLYQRFINWIGTLEADTDLVEEMSILDIWGVGDRFGVVPISTRKLYWAGGTAADTMATTTSASPKEELWSLFADWPSPVPEIIERAPTASINKIFVHDHDPIETWHKDNVILIGDAAHACLPTSGQGACQAIEDAWHLADCLTEHAGSLRVA